MRQWPEAPISCGWHASGSLEVRPWRVPTSRKLEEFSDESALAPDAASRWWIDRSGGVGGFDQGVMEAVALGGQNDEEQVL